MKSPTPAEIRAVAQPHGLLERRSGEHWVGRLYMRHISVYVTAVLARTPITPNQVTGVMVTAGVGAGCLLVVGGLGAAIGAAVLVQVYMLLDCCDGELARWTGRTSIAGVYADRVGHYLTDAALISGLGMRAASRHASGWLVLGLVAALCAILGKAETDLVDVARAKSGLPPVSDEAAEPRGHRLGRARRFASLFRVHRLVQAMELSVCVLGAAVYDAVAGGLTGTRVLVAMTAAVAGALVVLHLVSILASSRLR
ncbi:MAG: CDP-alcohol phosphatidyltransferase family protein [Actinomycetes bacterium]